MDNRDYVNSRIPCPICDKVLAKNYMTAHLKARHSNAYKTEWWDRYVKKYRETLKENREKFKSQSKIDN
jgi:phage FluMu protein Com